MSSYHISLTAGSKVLDFDLVNESENISPDTSITIGGVMYSVMCKKEDLEIVQKIIAEAEKLKIEHPHDISKAPTIFKLLEEAPSLHQLFISRLKIDDDGGGAASSSSSTKSSSQKTKQKADDWDPKKYKQTKVLFQIFDGTSSGAENCGFHALKNAIAAQLVNTKHHDLANALLTDKKLFLEFYQKYCEPLVHDSKDKDASIPILTLALDHFLADSKVSPHLLPFQQELLKNRDQIVLMNTSTTADPCSAFLGEEGLKQSKRILNFSQSSPPAKVVFVFGNENENHWFTIVAEKHLTGEMTFTCYDSFEADHSRLGVDSPFYKAVESMRTLFETPERSVDNATLDIAEALERKAALIGSDSEDVLKEKSEKEHILRDCISCYHAMKELNWSKSTDIEKQAAITTVLKILSFYQSASSDQMIGAIIDDINKTRETGWLIHLLDSEILAMETQANTLDGKEKEQAINVVELGSWIRNIYQERARLQESSELREKLRIEMSIEDDFSSDTVKEAERNVHLYILTIQTARKKDRLPDLIKEAGSPSCFTGRMGAISDFLPRLQWEEIDQLAVAGYTFLTSDVALSAFITSFIPPEKGPDDPDAVRSVKDFSIEQCQTDIKELADQFKMFAGTDSAIPFCEFLLKEGFTDTLPIKEWKPVLEKLVSSKFFPEILSRGKTQALRDL